MAPTTQKALTIPAEKEPFKLVTGWPVPQPSPTDVLFKLVSVVLNPVDAFVQAQGGHGLVPGYPYVAGFDGVGIVEEVGVEVTNVAKGEKLVQGTFNNTHTTFQEYTLQRAKYVGKMPHNITFDQAATISLCLATVDVSNWVRLTPPWEEGGTTKYAGQAALVLRGGTNVGQYALQCAHMQGFTPIITTSSPQDQERGVPQVPRRDACHRPCALPRRDPRRAPHGRAGHAFGRGRDHPQRLAYSVLTPGGGFVTVNPHDDGALTYVVKESEQKGEGKRIARASYSFPGNRELGVEIFKRVTGWLETGAIVPSRVEVIPGGLMENLVVHVDETP
ncbi:GroES-like protein [Ganoderma leucocontextum]|nr:GroES-like protein [Ganoderma leucocontextum]